MEHISIDCNVQTTTYYYHVLCIGAAAAFTSSFVLFKASSCPQVALCDITMIFVLKFLIGWFITRKRPYISRNILPLPKIDRRTNQLYHEMTTKYTCTISLAISYVSHLYVLIFVQCRTISNAMTRTGS